ncbi:MAG TPA: hypothetical protein PKA64_09890 [Myxococcota bacterium]|nr:hypothetical protein [Myxococcota bacterium]
MKVGAHPLLVAAAFGLLGPAALLDDPDDARERCVGEPCVGCDCGMQPGVEIVKDELPMVIVPGGLDVL